jgi:hypothetical protein
VLAPRLGALAAAAGLLALASAAWSSAPSAAAAAPRQRACPTFRVLRPDPAAGYRAGVYDLSVSGPVSCRGARRLFRRYLRHPGSPHRAGSLVEPAAHASAHPHELGGEAQDGLEGRIEAHDPVRRHIIGPSPHQQSLRASASKPTPPSPGWPPARQPSDRILQRPRLVGGLSGNTRGRRYLLDHAALGAADSQPSSLPQLWIRVKVVPPSARLGQLALGLAAQRGKLVLAQRLEQPRLERDAELERQTQIGVAGLSAITWASISGSSIPISRSSSEKSAACLAAQVGKDLGERSDQSLGRGRRAIEVPRAQIPLLENQ